MAWDMKSDRPIYIQIMEQVTVRIVSGAYPPGSQLPPVRELAAEAAVNPNTMQKALSELERDGLVYSHRTSGRFITEDKKMIKQAKDTLAMQQVESFFEKMRALGFGHQEVLKLMEQAATAQTNEEKEEAQ